MISLILIYELKNYNRSIEILKYLILYSNDPDERWKSQIQIAQIYFDNLAWYDRAIIEYSKLLSSELSKDEKVRIRLAIARSYYYLGKFTQSWSEASEIIVEQNISKEQIFDILLLQANINLALKKFSEAAKILERLNAQFPERSKKENIGINLALCYESNGDHVNALRIFEYLIKFYEPKEYIELRIKKIKHHFLNQPKKRLKK